MPTLTKRIKLPKFRGAPLALLKNHDHEVICAGPKDCAKTWGATAKMIYLCTDKSRPKIRGAMVRKTFHSLFNSCVQTLDTLTAEMPVHRMGGKTYRERTIFPNGSEIVCIGLDNPMKLQSSEWGFIYINQAEEIAESAFEMVSSCVTGRGTTIAFPQIFGDCNPAGASHWIRERAKSGKLTLLSATHKDNPALYDDAGNITEVGIARLAILESTLSGVRRKRLLEGIWATAEGAVFDTFDPAIHVLKRDPKEMKRWFLAIDEGFTNPCAILLLGDDSDGRRHLFKESYKTGQLPADVVSLCKEWFMNHKCELAAVDDAAAGLIADLKANGVRAIGGKGRIIDGINKIQDRLKVLGDGKPRLTIEPECVNTINEFESYRWREDKPKDVPYDEQNHSCSGLRYLEDVLAVPTGAVTDPNKIYIGPSSGKIAVPVYRGMRL